MVGYARGLLARVSTVFKLIFGMLGLILLSALSLSFLKGRRQGLESRQATSRKEGEVEVAREEGAMAVHHTEAAQAIAQAEVAESQAGALDVRIQGARDRIAALKKELGR